MNGHQEVARELLDRGADIEGGGEKPLGCASFGEHIRLVKWLLDEGNNGIFVYTGLQ